MPELDGLGVIEAVGPAAMPLTVFVTAYDQHAIRAFEANALDYLLKPYSDERLEATLARARTRLTETQAGNLLRLVAAPRAERHLDRLVVKSAGVTRFLRVDEIDWIEGAGNRDVNLHVAGKSLLYRSALTRLAASLDPSVSFASIVPPSSTLQHRAARCRLSWRIRCHPERRQRSSHQQNLSSAARATTRPAALASRNRRKFHRIVHVGLKDVVRSELEVPTDVEHRVHEHRVRRSCSQSRGTPSPRHWA